MRTTNRRIGLALSGGAVRGGAHIGVLKVMKAAGLEPDFVAGTSVGAIVGAAYAAGLTPAHLEELILSQTWSKLVRPSLNPKSALFKLAPAARFLGDAIGLKSFGDLHLPFAAVCCDINSGEAVAVRRGNLIEAVLASSAVPGLFPARELGGRLLVDGGIVNNLPVNVVKVMGADIIIAVDLLEIPVGGYSQRPANLFESWQRSLSFMILRNHHSSGLADHTIVPRLAELSFTDFDEVAVMIRRGEEAAQRSLSQLQQLVFE